MLARRYESTTPQTGDGTHSTLYVDVSTSKAEPKCVPQTTPMQSSSFTSHFVPMMAVYLCGWGLLMLSWHALYMVQEFGWNHKHYKTAALVAVLLACTGYTVWGLLVMYGPPRNLPNMLSFIKRIRHRNAEKRPHAHYLSWLFNIAKLALILLPSVWLFAQYLEIGISAAPDGSLSRELHLMLAVGVCTVFVACVIMAIIVVQSTAVLFPAFHKSCTFGRRLRFPSPASVVASIFICLTLVALWWVATFDPEYDMDKMRGTLLDVPGKDFCEAYGKRLDPDKLRGQWVLPAILPRRFFNFYLGSEKCRDESKMQLGFIDEESDLLIVPALCPRRVNVFRRRSEKPRVFLETPFNSELRFHSRKVFKENSKVFHEMLDAKYRSDSTVIIHRAGNRIIKSIEMNPEYLTSVHRAPKSDAEKWIRAAWPGDDAVFAIPLGHSLTYTVRCSSSKLEDYFIYPLTATKGLGSSDEHSSTSDAAAHDEPPANVLMLFFDAVSRPEVLRSLPKFTKWLRDFKQVSVHRVLEARSHTTVGYNTAANCATLLSGNIPTQPNTSNRTIFSLAKQRYGSLVQTSVNSDFCADLISEVFGRKNASSGFGDSDSVGGIDSNMFGPMCHLQYAGPSSNLKGGFSIQKRCMGSKHAYEHLLIYTKALLRQRLAEIREKMNSAEKGRFFLDLAYFIDGHEGSHSVLSLLDGALTEFMEELRVGLGFFADPRNAVVLFSDHGSHLGPYFSSRFEPGRLERTLPFLVFIIHPETFRRVDHFRGWPVGSSEAAMVQRVQNVTTQADLYMTMCDLVGVEPRLDAIFTRAPVVPHSIFNPFTASGHSDILVQMNEKAIVDKRVHPICTNWCV